MSKKNVLLSLLSWMLLGSILTACGKSGLSPSIKNALSSSRPDAPSSTEASSGNSSSPWVPSALQKADSITLEEFVNHLPENLRDCTAFDLEKYTYPLWKSNIVYNEPILFIDDGSGTIQAPLLFHNARIISVKDATLRTTYTEGVDFTYNNGYISVLPGSKIITTPYTDIYPTQEEPDHGTFPKIGGGYVKYTEGTWFHSRQTVVTYAYSGNWAGGKTEYQPSSLSKTLRKLKNKEPLKIVYFGDSITEGCNSSAFIRMSPKMPIWTDLVTMALKNCFDYDGITSVNTAVGGKDSMWAMETLQENVIDHAPDLVVLAFGMNDGPYTPRDGKWMQKVTGAILSKIHTALPDSEVILVSPMLPSAVAMFGSYPVLQYHKEYGAALATLKNEYTAYVDMGAVSEYLYMEKKFEDFTGNNINHPNDFMIRLYAQNILSTMME